MSNVGGRRGGGWPQVPLGKGSTDWVMTMTAARAGGVRDYFVDQTRGLTQQGGTSLKTLKV